jgi:hypothetical protein
MSFPRTLGIALLAAAGCGGTSGTQNGYLLLDQAARQAGMRVDVGDYHGTPLLPLALRSDERVVLAGPAGRLPLTLRPGTLAWVRGTDAAIEWTAVDPDTLIVEAPDAAAHELAGLLAAEAGVRSDGRWRLHAPELLDRASFLTAPEAILDVQPATLAGVASAHTSLVGNAPLPAARVEISAGAPAAARLVGLYSAEGKLLLLDAAGEYHLGCGTRDDLHGRYSVDGERVLLSPVDGQTWTLTPHEEALRDDAGALFARLTLDAGDSK